MKSPRLAPLSGIVFVVLLVLAFVVVEGDTPDLDDPAAKITSFYHDDQGQHIVAAILVGLSTIFLAVFTVSLRDYLRGSGAEGDFWPTLVLVGGSVAVAGFLVAVGVHVALTDGGDKNISPDAMVALNALDNDDFFAFALPLGVMMLGASGAILKAGAALPRWLGWAALVLFIVQFTPAGFAAFALTGVWIIIAGIVMYQRSGATAAPSAPAA
jgi:hypothetical protein